jgi:hypothetical protein
MIGHDNRIRMKETSASDTSGGDTEKNDSLLGQRNEDIEELV